MITDEQLVTRLRAGMAAEVQGHHLNGATVAARATNPTRRTRRVYVAAACGIVVAAAVAVGYAITKPGSSAPTVPSAASCSVHTGVLPTWARDGFSEPKPVMPQVLGDSGDIIAILWNPTQPLTSPPRRNETNKILWVSRKYGAPLVIHAHLGDTAVTREVAGGPGPSIIDMPRAGCWTFELSWGDNHDTLRLPYQHH